MEDNLDPKRNFVTKDMTSVPHTIKSMATLTMFGLMAVLLMAGLACGGAAPEPVIVEKEVIKEVIKEVVKEVVVTPTPEPAPTQLFVLSNSSPHVSVIDAD